MTSRICFGKLLACSAIINAVTSVFCVASLAFAQTNSQLVIDTFNRPNSTTLTPADTGQSWTVHYGSAEIDAGTARVSSGFVLASVNGGASKGSAEVRIVTPGEEFWLIVRLVDGSNYWRFGRRYGEAYQLQQVNGGGLGNPQVQVPAAVMPQAGDVMRCMLLEPGISCSVNGTVIASTTDSFAASGTRMGLSAYVPSAAVRFDDFVVSGPSPAPDLAVRVEGPLSTHSGGSVTWVATVENRGAGTAQAVELRITPPVGHPVLVIGGGPTCSSAGSFYSCSIGTLAAQANVRATITLPAVATVSSVTIAAAAPTVTGEIDTSQNAASFTTVVRAAIPVDALVVDTFDQPNGTVLGTARTGQTWTHHYEAIAVAQSQAAPSAGFTLSSIDSASATNKTSVAALTLAPEFWLIVRFENPSSYWRFGRWANQAYTLQQVVNGGLASPVITTVTSVTPAMGDTLSCNTTTSLLECAVNGVTVVRTTDSRGATATRVGLSTYQASEARFDDFVVTGPPPAPDVAVTLAGTALLDANTATHWTATVRNVATVPTQSVELNVTLPPSVTQQSFTGATCVPNGGSWRCSVGNLAPGQSVSIRMDAVAPSAGGRVTITAAIPAQSGEVEIANNTASFSTHVRSATNDNTGLFDGFDRADAPTLGVATTGQSWTAHAGVVQVKSGQAAPGSDFSLVSADVGKTVGEISVSLIVPGPEFWLISRLQDGGTYWRFGRRQNGAYDLQRIGGGAAPVITILATVMPKAGDLLGCKTTEALLECSVNEVVVARSTDSRGATATRVGLSAYDASAVRFDNLLVTGPPPVPDLAVTLTGTALLNASTAANWTATVRNAATIPASSVELTVTPPASLTQVSFTGGATCVASGGSWRCSIGNLAPGQTVSVRMDAVTPAVGGRVTITASVPAQSGEVVVADNTALFSTYVRSATNDNMQLFDGFDRADAPALGMATTGQLWTTHSGITEIRGAQAAPGSDFSLMSVEIGATPENVSVSLIAPAPEFWLISRLQDGGTYWRFGRRQNGAYDLQRIGGGAAPVITILATVMPKAGDLLGCKTTEALLECSVNEVVVARSTDSRGATATRVGLSAYDASAARFDNLLVTGPPPAPDLAVILTGTALLNASTAANWTTTVRNVAPIPVSSVDLTVTPPSSLTQVVLTGATCVASGGSWRCSISNLAPGQSVSVRMDAVTPAAGGRVTITASVAAQSGEVVVANNSAAFSTHVRSATNDSTGLFDAFDRPDASALGVATTGQSWTAHSGSIGIRNGQAAPGNEFSLASIDVGKPVAEVSISIVVPASEFWLVVRLQDGQNYWRFGRWQNRAYELQRIGGGAGPGITTLANVVAAAGDQLHCSMGATGMVCSVNGVAVASTTDTTGQESTRVGFSAYAASSARFDDLLVLGPTPVPNVTVTTNAPRHVIVAETHLAEVVMRNEGNAASGTGTLLVTLPTSIIVASRPPECAPQGTAFSCTTPVLAAAAEKRFTFSLRSDDALPFTGRAVATVNGDSVLTDNTTTWRTSVHPTSGTSVLDRFDRANTSAGLGTSPTQHPWTALSPGFRIANGLARADASGAIAVVNPQFAFGTIEVTLGTSAATTGILFRVADVNNYFRLGVDQNGYYALRKVINGVSLPLTSVATRAQVRPASGDVVRISTRPDDGVFVAINGNQIIDAGDGDLMVEASLGWGIASINGPASVDEVVVMPKIEGYRTVDTFDLPNGSGLDQPTIGSKYNWKLGIGPMWTTTDGRARPNSSQYTYTWVDTNTEQATVKAKIVNGGSGGWVIFRINEFDGTHYRFGQKAGAYVVEFMHHDSLASLPVAVQTITSPTAQTGDVVEVRQSPDGTVECSVNGALVKRFVDNATNTRWTLYGLAASSSQAAFDDFEVTPFSR